MSIHYLRNLLKTLQTMLEGQIPNTTQQASAFEFSKNMVKKLLKLSHSNSMVAEHANYKNFGVLLDTIYRELCAAGAMSEPLAEQFSAIEENIRGLLEEYPKKNYKGEIELNIDEPKVATAHFDWKAPRVSQEQISEMKFFKSNVAQELHQFKEYEDKPKVNKEESTGFDFLSFLKK